MTSSPVPLPTYFISHGGGPWPWMKGELNGAYDRIEAALKAMPRQIGMTPKAVLVNSGHWEEREFTVMSSPKPPMIHDYAGFPAHTYRISYPAPGSPRTAERVCQLIEAAGFSARLNPLRGFDHIAIGLALAPLRNEGVLILGSGLSYHNLREFGPKAQQPSAAGNDRATCVYHQDDFFGGITVSSFRFGGG